MHGDRRGDELPEIVAAGEGRQRWLRAARQRLDQERAERAEPIPRSRPQRLLDAKQRLEEELVFERHGNDRNEKKVTNLGRASASGTFDPLVFEGTVSTPGH